jgi:arylsulfatase A-like enzyme
MDHLTDDALGFVREHRDERFFLYLAYPVPHLALQVPDEDLREYAGAFDETPYRGDRGYLPHPTPRAAYAAMITRMDSDIGRLMALLADLGLDENTLVVFASDNGPSWVGGVDREFFDSSGGLRGRKAQLYEGGIRVPMIARWPGRVAPGSVSDHVSAFWDVLPTFAELAGAPTPAALDGLSMVPTLLGRPHEQTAHELLYWEHARAQQAIRVGDWKAHRKRPGDPIELYDLSSDPGEQHDVAARHPEVVARLTALMRDARTPSEHFPLKSP